MPWFFEKSDTIGLAFRITACRRYASRFQKIEVIDTVQYGKMLVLDGLVQTTVNDEFIYHEMLVHVPMITHPNAKNILVIGGGDGGAVRELCKYKGVEIYLVEIDPKVIEVSLKEFPELSKSLLNKNVHIINQNGNHFIKGFRNDFDIIIVDCSDPVSHSKSLFGETFFCKIKKALKEDGIYAFQSESPFLYLDFLKKIRKSLLKYFPVVHHYLAPIPTYPTGLWSFTLASLKHDLSFVPAKLTRIRSLRTRYFNESIYSSCFSLPTFLYPLKK